MVCNNRSALLGSVDFEELVIMRINNADLVLTKLMTRRHVCTTIRKVLGASGPGMGLSSTL